MQGKRNKTRLRMTNRGRLLATMLFVWMSASGSTYVWQHFTN